MKPSSISQLNGYPTKDPSEAAYMDTLAGIQYSLGRKEEALSSFEVAVKLMKRDGEINWALLGKLYEEMGQSEKAQKIRERHARPGN